MTNSSRLKNLVQQINFPSWQTLKGQLVKTTYSEKDGAVQEQPTLVGHIVITTSLLVVIGGSFLVFDRYAAHKASQWLEEPAQLSLISGNLQGSVDEKLRLEQQFNEIQLRLQQNTAVMIYFYKQYYISISMALGLTVIAGICGFFISRVGWEKANNALINIFIVTSSTAFLYGQLPLIFRQETNLEASKSLYFDYITLRNEILSYAVTGGTVSSGLDQASTFENVPLRDYIHYIDQRIARLNQIPIDFDMSRVKPAPNFPSTNIEPTLGPGQ